MSEFGMERDYLWDHIKALPYFRGLLRAVEARAYQQFELTRPILDIGCGDGHFVTTVFDQPIEAGIDPWFTPLKEALQSRGYKIVIQGSGEKMPFQDGFFSSCISNSVLEHIPEVDKVLQEAARVIIPGGLFVFCVPNHNFLPNLSISTWLDKINMRALGDLYRGFFNRISRHHHCDPPEIWIERLSNAGFKVEKWWHYFSPEATGVLEWGHYLGLPSLITRRLFGRWIALPTKWNLNFTYSRLRRFYEESPEQPKGSYTFFIARRDNV